MRGQSKDHATLRKLCSKFHWLSVPPTVFNVRLTRQRRHNLPRAMQVKARICRQSCHNLNIQRQYQMQNCFGMLLHAPDSHGEIEALLLEVQRCGVKALAARRYRARLQNLSRSAKVRWQVWGMDACQSFSQPSHDREPAVASLDAQRPQRDRRRRGSDQSRCGPSHMARPAPALLRIPDRKNGLWPTQTAARVTAATGPPPAHWPWMQTRSRGAGDTARDPRRFCDLCGILRRTAAEAAAWIETISERGESGTARPAHAGPAATPARNQCSTKRCSRKAPGLRLGKGAWGRKGSAANSDGRWPPQKGLRPRPRRPPPPRRPAATASTPGMQPLPNAAT